ncbi:MAG: indole-3-glycerol phosphate synthase TrpC [Dysgonamonadaceae bacterium]
MKDMLDEIVTYKRIEVADKKQLIPIKQLERIIEQEPKEHHSLKEALQLSDSGIISEFKRKSPSKGWIKEGANAERITMSYEKYGATALSVLTDNKFFGGSLNDLREVRKAVSIPIMRKEFIIDEYQIYEAASVGADAILLIAASITKEESRRFTNLAHTLKMDVLLELHDEKEIHYISDSNLLIGINNRNLGTFVTDVQKSFMMIDHLPKEAVLVSESGISSPELVKELRDAGYKGFLIGENFMKTADPGESLGIFISQLKAL